MAFRLIAMSALMAMGACSAEADAVAGGDAAPVVVPVSGVETVDRFLRDLADGNQSAAVAQVGGLESLAGPPPPFSGPQAYVEKLITCQAQRAEVLQRMMGLVRVTWACPEGRYVSMIDPDYRAPKLTLLDFMREGAAPPSPQPPQAH